MNDFTLCYTHAHINIRDYFNIYAPNTSNFVVICHIKICLKLIQITLIDEIYLSSIS